MTLCKHCGMDIAIRNPSGYCDHLYYPENCKICATKEKGDTRAYIEGENGKRYYSAPAVPPEGYKGTIADWIVGLISMGKMEDGDFYGDVTISCDEWWTLLERCEGEE